MSAKSSSSVMATSTLRTGCDGEPGTRGTVRPVCQGCGLMVSFLTSLPAWLLVLGSIVVTLLVAASGRLVAAEAGSRRRVRPRGRHRRTTDARARRALCGADRRDRGQRSRVPQDRPGERRQRGVGGIASGVGVDEVGVDPAPIQAALGDYLRAIRADEWSTDDANSETDDRISSTVAALEVAVRDQAARSELGTPTSTELLTSVDSLTSARRTRLAEASRQMPALYVLTLIASGAALVANAGVLGFRSTWRTAMLSGRTRGGGRTVPQPARRHQRAMEWHARGERRSHRRRHRRPRQRLLRAVVADGNLVVRASARGLTCRQRRAKEG